VKTWRQTANNREDWGCVVKDAKVLREPWNQDVSKALFLSNVLSRVNHLSWFVYYYTYEIDYLIPTLNLLTALKTALPIVTR
jgi:hypothetical protein